MISDRDPRFASHFSRELCKQFDIKQNISSAYHPQTDGQSERTNQKLEQYLRFWCSTRQDDWADWLPFTQFALNSWPNATTKTSPFELLMGHQPRAHWTPKASPNPSIEAQINGLISLRKTAQDCILKAQSLMARTPKAFTPYVTTITTFIPFTDRTPTGPIADPEGGRSPNPPNERRTGSQTL